MADRPALGQILTDYEFFGTESGASVRLSKADDRFVVSFVLMDRAWEDEEVIEYFQGLGEHLVTTRLSRPLTIEFCNGYFEPQRTLTIR